MRPAGRSRRRFFFLLLAIMIAAASMLLLFVFVVAHWQAAIRAAVAAGATGTGTGPTGSGVNNGCRWFGSYDRLSEAMAPVGLRSANDLPVDKLGAVRS